MTLDCLLQEPLDCVSNFRLSVCLLVCGWWQCAQGTWYMHMVVVYTILCIICVTGCKQASVRPPFGWPIHTIFWKKQSFLDRPSQLKHHVGFFPLYAHHMCSSMMCLSLPLPRPHLTHPLLPPPSTPPNHRQREEPTQKNKQASHGLHSMPWPRPRPGSNPPKGLQQPSSQELGPFLPFHPCDGG